MQVSISTDNYKIVDSQQVFLFSETSDLRIEIDTNENFTFSVVLLFAKDDSGIEKIESGFDKTTMFITCYNFSDSGTGLSEPANIATVKDKKIYLQFWSYVEGLEEKKRVRSVKYTIYIEK